MQKTINRSAIKNLEVSPASGTKRPIWDIQIPGFGAYLTSKGRVSFVYQYRMPGGQTQSKLIGYHGELNVEQARDRAGEFARQRREGIDPLAAERASTAEEAAKTDLVLANYVAKYLARRISAGKPLGKARTATVMNDVVGLLGNMRIDKMSVADVEEFAATLGERGHSPRRCGIVELKTILNDARKRGMINRSPAEAIETPKAGVRDRRLRHDEIQRFYEAACDVGGPRGDIYVAILRLMKRKDEVSRMTWEQLDLAQSRWFLPSNMSKNGHGYEIVLPRQVIEIIEAQQPDGTLRRGPVFTLDAGKTSPEMGSQPKDLLDANMHRRLELANERDRTALSVAHFTVHDLRTTGASQMQKEPLNVRSDRINAVLLHVVGSGVTPIYQQAKLALEAGVALQAWNDWLDELISGASAWPGGRELPTIAKKEALARLSDFRKGWPERADQKRAREAREANGGSPPRKRRSAAE